MKAWYEITYTGRMADIDVKKTVQAAVTSNCTWTEDKLDEVLRGNIRKLEPAGMATFSILDFRELRDAPSASAQARYDRVFDLDEALGI